jgi:hypothetical protein
VDVASEAYGAIMPSAQHESPIALTKLNPDWLAWLFAHVFHAKMPSYDHARSEATDVRVLVPRTYHADAMVLFCDPEDRPVQAAVLEVQRGRDPTKQRTWKLYVAQLETEWDVATVLVVYCPDPAVAGWYRRRLAVDGDGNGLSSLRLSPFVFTPDDVPVIVDVDEAIAQPELTVLSVLCHGDKEAVDAMFPALWAILRPLESKKFARYYDIVLAGLPEAARLRLEAFMTTTPDQFLSKKLHDLTAEHQQIGEARGKAEGKAEGEARGRAASVLGVLKRRGVPVPDAVREQILGCADLSQLEIWFDRAFTADTVDDVIRE